MVRRNSTSMRRLAWAATAFAFCVIVFGAFVRLSDAGLSCPDWPTCYGKATWPGHEHEVARANAAFPERPVEHHKTWREQVHRMLAGSLGVMVLALALLASRGRPIATWLVLAGAALAAIGVGLYLGGWRTSAGVLSVFAIGLPLLAALGLGRPAPWRIAIALLSVIIFQAMLGMWTVTLLLKPIVVMAHLLGGLLTFALLAQVGFTLGPARASRAQARLRPWVALALAVLVVQIALGGWTSANYAALVCGIDFPRCAGSWWPSPDFREGFVLWRGIGVNYEGGVLDVTARAAIQIAHRIGAVFASLAVLGVAIAAWLRGLRLPALLVVALLVLQAGLGIANVRMLLPLGVATAHNAVAALLLLALLGLLARTRRGVA